MDFNRQEKINRLLSNTFRIYKNRKQHRLNVPVEICQLAITEGTYSRVAIFLSGHILFSGKMKSNKQNVKKISNVTGIKERTVYTGLKELNEFGWIGKDKKNQWTFFRGIDQVSYLNGLRGGRAVSIYIDDLNTFKEFAISAVISNAIETGTARVDRGKTQVNRKIKKASMQATYWPVPVSFLKKVFNVSVRTAKRYSKIARRSKYLKYKIDRETVLNLTPNDVRVLRHERIKRVDVETVEGFSKEPVKKLVLMKGEVLIQKPNLFSSNLTHRIRKGSNRRKYFPQINNRIS